MKSKALLPGELVIAVDFDGTITTDPNGGEELVLRENCREVLAELRDAGVKLILWTCRTGEAYKQCIDFLIEQGLYHMFSAYNKNLPQVQERYDIDARKVGADLYIDDKGFGVNLDNLWSDVIEYVFGVKESIVNE